MPEVPLAIPLGKNFTRRCLAIGTKADHRVIVPAFQIQRHGRRMAFSVDFDVVSTRSGVNEYSLRRRPHDLWANHPLWVGYWRARRPEWSG
jgi:hypothetical protein